MLVCLRLHAFEWQAFGEGQLLFPERSGTKHSKTCDLCTFLIPDVSYVTCDFGILVALAVGPWSGAIGSSSRAALEDARSKRGEGNQLCH